MQPVVRDHATAIHVFAINAGPAHHAWVAQALNLCTQCRYDNALLTALVGPSGCEENSARAGCSAGMSAATATSEREHAPLPAPTATAAVSYFSFEILDDGQRLGNDHAIVIERGDEPRGFNVRYSGALCAPLRRCMETLHTARPSG